MQLDPEIPTPSGELAAAWHTAARRCAVVALLFCGVVLLLLVGNAHRLKAANPINAPKMQDLTAQIAAVAGKDAAATATAVQAFRAADQELRQAYFHANAAARHGGLLLLAGVAVYILASRLAGVFQPVPSAPRHGLPQANAWQANQRTQQIIMAAIALCALAIFFVAYVTPPPSALPSVPAATPTGH